MQTDSKTPIVKFCQMRPNAVLPRYMTLGAAAMDLSSAEEETVVIHPGSRLAIHTGWAIEIPPGYEAQVRPRSGSALKYGVTVLNSPGTIDSDYRGEVGVILVNLGRESFYVHPKDRIAQMVIAPVIQANIQVVEELSITYRGSCGLGSTGVSNK